MHRKKKNHNKKCFLTIENYCSLGKDPVFYNRNQCIAIAMEFFILIRERGGKPFFNRYNKNMAGFALDTSKYPLAIDTMAAIIILSAAKFGLVDFNCFARASDGFTLHYVRIINYFVTKWRPIYSRLLINSNLIRKYLQFNIAQPEIFKTQYLPNWLWAKNVFVRKEIVYVHSTAFFLLRIPPVTFPPLSINTEKYRDK